MKKILYLLLPCALMGTGIFSQTPATGAPLPAWQKGYLDLHHINTGRGNAAIYILPDGTTMLLDAGEISPLDSRTFTYWLEYNPEVPPTMLLFLTTVLHRCR